MGQAPHWLVLMGILSIAWFLPRELPVKPRLIAGFPLSVIGGISAYAGLGLRDDPLMESESVVDLWIGLTALCVLIGMVLLFSALFEGLRRWKSGVKV